MAFPVKLKRAKIDPPKVGVGGRFGGAKASAQFDNVPTLLVTGLLARQQRQMRYPGRGLQYNSRSGMDFVN